MCRRSNYLSDMILLNAFCFLVIDVLDIAGGMELHGTFSGLIQIITSVYFLRMRFKIVA